MSLPPFPQEDNIIDQLKAVAVARAAPALPFVGDETWAALFPGRFAPATPYASFNVRDLDTCDRGVLQRLPNLLQAHPQAPLVVAHMLGVDHAGHRFGPVHQAMARKLRDVNAVIEQAVLPHLQAGDILVVVGDHGMSPTGDHGGESQAERSAALFLYSPGKTLSPLRQDAPRPHQTDLVPTLSLLLGSPIPYSSLGAVITAPFDAQQRLQALQVNAHQVRRLLDAYGPALAKERVAGFAQTLADAEAAADEEEAERLYRAALSHARRLAEEAWASFDTSAMVFGAALCAVAAVAALLAPMQLLRLWPAVVREVA